MKNQFTVLAMALLAASAAHAQLPATFQPAGTINVSTGEKTQITIYSSYNDCSMTINVASGNPNIATLAPVSGNSGFGPVTYYIFGVAPGTTFANWNITGVPGSCIFPTTY